MVKIEQSGTPKKYPKNYESWVKLCPKCKRTWYWGHNETFKKVLVYVSDYPKYGLDLDICPSCKRYVKLKRRSKLI